MAASDGAPRGRIVLVSDWHLPPDHTPQTDLFVRFTDEVCGGAARVFVLGDLFGAWIGPKHAACPGHAAVLGALERLARSGTRVVLTCGNRDFLLDKRTARRHGLELVRVAWRGELVGRRVRLSHGDEWSQNDRFHKVMRAFASHFPASTFVKALPRFASGWLARGYQWFAANRRSRRRGKKLRPDERRVRAEFSTGADLIVIGHWHEPGIQTDALGLPGKTFVMLGECTAEVAIYAELLDGSIRLCRFPP